MMNWLLVPCCTNPVFEFIVSVRSLAIVYSSVVSEVPTIAAALMTLTEATEPVPPTPETVKINPVVSACWAFFRMSVTTPVVEL